MTCAASVAADARLRLFYGLRLPGEWVQAIADWQAEAFAGRDVRAVPREHLHATLVFLGSRPAHELPVVVDRLRTAVAASGPVELRLDRYRETRSVGMLVFEDLGGAGAALADALGHDGPRPWLPHVTVARFRERPRVEKELPGTRRTPVLVPSDAAAYLSRLRPSGAEYEVVASIRLGGNGNGQARRT